MKIERFSCKDPEIMEYIHSVYDGVPDYLLPPQLPVPNFPDPNKTVRLTHKIMQQAYNDIYFYLYYILGAYFTYGHSAIYDWGKILKNRRFVCIL
jgi:hypothetical protein